MGRAALLSSRRLAEMESKVRKMRDSLQEGIMRIVPGAKLNGHPVNRLPNTLNITLPGIRGESLLLAMDFKGVYFSSGSACKSGSPMPSHVLLAMGLSEEEAHCSLRFSLSFDNTDEQVERTLKLIKEVIHKSTNSVRFVSCR
jgi:cysteine sulfinate desulfinase/cysteine desulfurase-like protein